MPVVRRGVVLALVTALTLGACGSDDGGGPEGGAPAATGADVDADALAAAVRPTAADLEAIVGTFADSVETSQRHCDAGRSLFPGTPEPDTVTDDPGVEVSGRDGGVRYTVVVRAQAVVHADADAAREALAALDAAAWGSCVADARPDQQVDEATVIGADDRVAVDAPITTGPEDDTTYLAGARLARVGRTIVVVDFSADGQVLDRFGDGGPVNDLVDDLADRVAALG